MKHITAVFLAMVLALNLFTGSIPMEKAVLQETSSFSPNIINEDDSTIEVLETEAYDGNIMDENGKMIVPFDIAYPEAFASGTYSYDQNSLLIKMREDFDGELIKSLEVCGAKTIEYLCPATQGGWYRIGLAEGTDIAQAMKAVRTLDEVLMADYDYQVESDAIEVDSPKIETVAASNWWNSKVSGNPRVSEQWYLNDCNLQEAWAFLESKGINPGGSSSVVVAVIDTGVDYTHPDLATSMWKNLGEIPGNGIDDDGNGYVDDVHGVSTIGSTYDHTGNPMDDHGHGTHVAGIIGAANNKEGIVGVAYGVKIMAVKAGQATGVFNQSDIAEAIMYAYENGADVINMSFGGSACSLAVQDALETAFSRATLVASAGNDRAPNDAFEDGIVELSALPNYPAALNFVIGVMSVDQAHIESIFTNWDVYPNNSSEYEVYAPGESILSTLPDGKYGYLSGTSMAAPIVSGIAALLRSYYTDGDMYPAKFIDGQIFSTSEKQASCSHDVAHNIPNFVNAYSAMTKLPKPDVYLYDTKIFDDISFSPKNNGDGFIDAGETLYIAPILYNYWGMSKDTVITIDDIGSFGMDNPYVEILTGYSDFESVGTYSIKDQLKRDENGLVIGADEPLIVKVKEDCPNDYLVVLNVTLSYKNGLDESDANSYIRKTDQNGNPLTISFWVRNGAKFPNVIDQDTVITNDKYYILDGTCTILRDVTLTIEEGVQIQMSRDSAFNSFGTLVIQGTEDNPVFIQTPGGGQGERIAAKNPGKVYINYANIEGDFEINATEINHCNFIGKTGYQSVNANNIYYSNILNAGITAINLIGSFIDFGSGLYSLAVNASFIRQSIFTYSNSSQVYVNANYFEECIFDGMMALSAYNTTYSNCVFMNHTAYSDNDLTNQRKGYALDISVTNSIYDATTQTTYVECYLGDFVHNQSIVSQIANCLRGDVVCIETIEEYTLLDTNNFQGYCALKYGNTVWENGAEIGDWITFVEAASPEYSYVGSLYEYQYIFLNKSFAYFNGLANSWANYKNNLYFGDAYITGYTSKYIIFEIPSKEQLTEEEIQLKLDAYMESNKIHSLYNCAIINNFNSESGWIHVYGDTKSDYTNCQTIDIPKIYWGTTDLELIEKQIIDFDDEPYQRDQIDPSGFLTEAPSDTMPFVVDAYLLNQNGERVRTVNNETVTFVVEFNRDMDTSVPLKVTFGSSEEYFYEDYNISEYGTWVTPRRWEAKYTLKTIIENGNHTIKIENGCAADDEWLKLYDVPGRFMFEIDTTAAQALIMQGYATETGIQLSWTQDDFDILMGYNIYRSDREDGYYQRLNTSVVPFDQKEFFDDTVEPGKVYYYNFTVVKTDLTESEPSGKISLMSMDTMAPNIYHSPVRSGFIGNKIIVSATITDNLAVHSATLYWRIIGENTWHKSEMTGLNSSYSGIVYGEYVTEKGVEYYIDAYDGVSHTYKGSANTPYQVSVKIAVDANTLGDVDGDGIITSKDALMLMQAANDLLNLSEEQFLRADINGDKELSASEALLILQYVSGKITTITG